MTSVRVEIEHIDDVLADGFGHGEGGGHPPVVMDAVTSDCANHCLPGLTPAASVASKAIPTEATTAPGSASKGVRQKARATRGLSETS